MRWRGPLHPSIAALPDFGELRARVALDRGAVDLDLPDQEVVRGGDGWSVELAPRTPADGWNSQLSLLTGTCAGKIMADAGVGLLRTLPAGKPEAVDTLRATASALGVTWPDGYSPDVSSKALRPNSRRPCIDERGHLADAGPTIWSSAAVPMEYSSTRFTVNRYPPPTPATPPSPDSTRTSPRHYVGSVTGSPPRCACR